MFSELPTWVAVGAAFLAGCGIAVLIAVVVWRRASIGATVVITEPGRIANDVEARDRRAIAELNSLFAIAMRIFHTIPGLFVRLNPIRIQTEEFVETLSHLKEDTASAEAAQILGEAIDNVDLQTARRELEEHAVMLEG